MTRSITRFTVIACRGPECQHQYVGDLRFDLLHQNTARVPIIDRALAAAGWVTVGDEPLCPECFQSLQDEAAADPDELELLARELATASSVRAQLMRIEVG